MLPNTRISHTEKRGKINTSRYYYISANSVAKFRRSNGKIIEVITFNRIISVLTYPVSGTFNLSNEFLSCTHQRVTFGDSSKEIEAKSK